MKSYKTAAFIAISLGVLLFIGAVISYTWNEWGNISYHTTVNTDKLSSLGSLLSGLVGTLWSLGSLLLFYVALREQRQDNNRNLQLQAETLHQQSEAFVRSQIESRVFELIRYHRDNIASLTMRDPKDKSGTYVEGKKVTREIHKQVVEMLEHVREVLKDYTLDELYINPKVKLRDLANIEIVDEDKLKELCIINIAYMSVFFGGSTDGLMILKERLNTTFDELKLSKVYTELESRRAKWHNEVKYYEGHQYRLGHLFRHLYQTVVYIDKQSHLSYDEKYEYVKTLRAQISTYEQSLLFFNSLCYLGRPWELKVKVPSAVADKTLYLNQNKLITKYNVVRNIANSYVKGVKIKDYYPLLSFDGEEESPERLKLVVDYNKPPAK